MKKIKNGTVIQWDGKKDERERGRERERERED